MNVKEMCKDSVKYAFNGRLEFLFLGILLWTLDFIFNFINESILSLALLIPWLLFLFVQLGYLAKIIEDTIWGLDVYPKFENFKELIYKGIKELFIISIYSLIPAIVFMLFIIDLLFYDISSSMALLAMFLISLLFSLIAFQGAIIHYEYNHSKLKSAFEIRTIVRKLRSMGSGRFISSFLIVLLLTTLIELEISMFSEEPSFLISIIVGFTLLPFIAIFVARFTGLIGRYHFKEE